MREFLMLAHPYNPDKHLIAGWYVSEKLDGQRCFWDGGVSRGKPTVEVPWANLQRKVKPVATGLWSRYGNVIVAPDYFLDSLPVGLLLDGELYCGNFQQLRTIVSTDVADPEDWKKVNYIVFDSPGFDLFTTDKINNPNFTKHINHEKCVDYLSLNGGIEIRGGQFNAVYQETLGLLPDSDKIAYRLSQIKLPIREDLAREEMYSILNSVVNAGGEGIMLRDPRSIWIPKRVNTLLKVKPMLDSEAMVVGHVDGEGRLDGMLGALTVKWNSKIFNLGTGFHDSERKKELYPIGTIIRFKYTSLTGDGVPREARFDTIRTLGE